MLQVKSVNQYYGESHTLWDLDMHIPEGKCTVLMGRNGVGKTTLLQCIMGLVKVESGDISLSGQSLLKVRCRRATKTRNWLCTARASDLSHAHGPRKSRGWTCPFAKRAIARSQSLSLTCFRY